MPYIRSFAVNQSLALIALPAVVLAAEPVFTQSHTEVGLSYSYLTAGSTFDFEFMLAGGAVGDFDRDGDQDFFALGGGGSSDKLFINDGTGNFTDQAASWGVQIAHRGAGAAVGDFNNDGYLDIFVTSQGPAAFYQTGHNKLYRNNGDNTFTNIASSAGVSTTTNNNGDAFSAAFGDYDLDGDLDLFVTGWLGGNKLYRNNGNETFSDTTASLGTPVNFTRGYAVRFVDMDGDRYPEILHVADFGTSHYFINNTDGTFTDATISSGTGLDSNGMGNTFADYNNDARFDWYVTSLTNDLGEGPGSGNMLYQQTSTPHVYNEISVAAGCNEGYWSWGASSIDFNNDGHVDIVDTNGARDKINQNDPTLLFMNDGTGNFNEQAVAAGIDHTGQGRGLLNADFDRDGDQDILILCNRQPAHYYRNDIDAPDANSVTLHFNTNGVSGLAPDGFGTHASFISASNTQVRYLDGGSNYLAQSELSMHVGLGSDTSALTTITYANGNSDTLFLNATGTYTIKATNCPADLAPNAIVDIFDVLEFITLFNNAHPQGDFTDDGTHDIFDVLGFINAFNTGCP